MDSVAPPTATPTPSAAPATSGATSGETRPASFEEAFARDASASPAETPATPSSSTDQPAPATVAPETPTPAVTPTPGPIPYERHKSVLDNAYAERDQARQEALALRAQFDSPEGQRLRQWGQAYTQDPAAWFRQTVAELSAAHPDLVGQIRSDAARLLGSRQQAETSLEPDIPVYDESGREVNRTFSAERVQAIVQRAVADAIGREVQPIKQDFQQRKQQEYARQESQRAEQSALAQFNEMKDEPGFLVKGPDGKDVVDPDIAKAFAEHPEWSLETCYRKVVGPKQRARAQAEQLDHLKTKAAAASGVNPAGAAVTSTHKPRSFHDPSLQWT